MIPLDKSPSKFLVKGPGAYLANCAIGPLYAPAARAAQDFLRAHAEEGLMMAPRVRPSLDTFRDEVAALLQTSADDVAYVSNTAEGVSMIANGYPFEPGDQVLSYVNEFPSNHLPWVKQQERGVELVLISDVDPLGDLPADRPRGWSMEELQSRITDRTRVIALSHVQFASGFAADLTKLGALCRDHDIDLVIDAAQSLGALPVHPEVHGIAAVVASAWKWMLGPRGAGLMYVSPALRSKLALTVVGDASMQHRLDYLNRTWEPYEGARRFEYSTLPWEHLIAIESVTREVFNAHGMDAISAEIFRLQSEILAHLDHPGVRPVRFEGAQRSGILSLVTEKEPSTLARRLRTEGIIVTAQSGYVRLAPHFYLDDDEAHRAAAALNRLA